MKNRFVVHSIVLMALIIISGCKTDTNDKINETALEKNWEVVGASRNGQKTETMNGAYFNFADNMLKTNYMMREVSKPFKFNTSDNTIDIGDEEKVLKVHFISEDSMHVSTEIRNIPFDFYLK